MVFSFFMSRNKFSFLGYLPQNFESGWRLENLSLFAVWVMFCAKIPKLIRNNLWFLFIFVFCRNKEGAIIWPMSRIKQVLSNDNCLHHIVQLLLTFDPVIVEKVATLLYKIVEDNVFMSKLYTTGVFYFILMYNGSNVLPIARFLKLTHSKQAFHADEVSWILFR